MGLWKRQPILQEETPPLTVHGAPVMSPVYLHQLRRAIHS